MTVILPGGTIGVLGSGQLGRMFAIAARQMGYRVHTLSPADDTPTGQVADVEIKADYEDLDAVRRFAKRVDVVTFEFENVPSITTKTAAEHTIVRPEGQVLHTTQHRLREKTFLRDHGFPLADFRTVRSEADLVQAVQELGTPAILKSADWGYDGKGQVKITAPDQARNAWQGLQVAEAVLEAYIPFEREVSVVAARGIDGAITCFDVFHNQHQNHILDVTTSPAQIPASVEKQALEIARGVMEQLQVVGVLCVEFFLTEDHQLLVNELAPRPHNSGHLTVDACVTSQFEQQVRSVCGLPLGSPELLRPGAMANLLGDLWLPEPPDWSRACHNPQVKLHLYGKLQGRVGRKMGHLTALAPSTKEAEHLIRQARETLRP